MDRVKKAFWIFALLTIFTMIADRLLFILFPVYLIQNNFSATDIGLIFSAAALILAIFRTVIGRMSDIYGRKKLMSIGLLIDGVAISFYPAAAKIYDFIFVKGVKEIGWTLQQSLGSALEADSFPKKIRPRYLAKLGIIFPFGRAIAAVTGIIILTYFSFVFGFYVAAASMFIAFLIFYLFYEDSCKKTRSKKIMFNPMKYSSKVNIMAFVAFINALVFCVAYQPAFFILAEKYLSVTAETLFTIFLIAYIIATFLVYFISRHIRNFGNIKILILTLIIYSVFVINYAFVNDLFSLAITAIAIALTFYISRVSFRTIAMDVVNPKKTGEELGFIHTMDGLGCVTGPLVGGVLIDSIGIQVPFLVAGSLYLIAAVVLYLKIKSF